MRRRVRSTCCSESSIGFAIWPWETPRCATHGRRILQGSVKGQDQRQNTYWFHAFLDTRRLSPRLTTMAHNQMQKEGFVTEAHEGRWQTAGPLGASASREAVSGPSRGTQVTHSRPSLVLFSLYLFHLSWDHQGLFLLLFGG